jgi:hypothetical protein
MTRRNPKIGQALSVVPGLGQVYYGAPLRGLQYLAGVVVPGVLALVTYYLSFDLGRLGVGPIFTGIGLLLSLLLALSLVVTMVSFWIAAWWDAKQGTIAANAGAEYRPRWWYVKLKEFLFDDPDDVGESL